MVTRGTSSSVIVNLLLKSRDDRGLFRVRFSTTCSTDSKEASRTSHIKSLHCFFVFFSQLKPSP
jgi:hypothetical protein